MKAAKLKQASGPEKDAITNALRGLLEHRPEISFAYIHGSFIEETGFQDIDVALYLSNLPRSALEYELALETELMEKVKHYEIDVRILNRASLSFKYHVIKEGVLLLVRDNNRRTDFIEETLRRYFDFDPFRKEYLREVFSA